MCLSRPLSLLLIDGYNVIAPSVPPRRSGDARWLQRERMRLIRRLARHLDPHIRQRTTVVFDAANPPPDRPSRFEIDEIEVWFAVDYPEADDLLEELISSHSAPKRLAVVSSDQRVQTAATRRGCTAFASDAWLDDLLDSKVALAVELAHGEGQGSDSESADEKPDTVSRDDAQAWLQEFGFDPPNDSHQNP